MLAVGGRVKADTVFGLVRRTAADNILYFLYVQIDIKIAVPDKTPATNDTIPLVSGQLVLTAESVLSNIDSESDLNTVSPFCAFLTIFFKLRWYF